MIQGRIDPSGHFFGEIVNVAFNLSINSTITSQQLKYYDMLLKNMIDAKEISDIMLDTALPDPPAAGELIDPDDLPDSLPAYLIDVKPQIRIDSEVKATGDAVTMGNRQNFQMNFFYPDQIGMSSDTINNEVTAGAQYVVTLDTGRISQEQLEQKQAKLKDMKQNLEKENLEKVQLDAITEDIFHTIGLSYFAELDMFNNLLEHSHGVKAARITSAAITVANLNVSYMLGQPRTASPGGLSIDVDRDLSTVKSVNGDDEKEKSYNKTSGIMGSYLEGSIFEQTFGGEAVSTMHIINYANRNGIKVYTIDQDNVDIIIRLKNKSLGI